MQAIKGTGFTPKGSRNGAGRRPPPLGVENAATLAQMYPFNCSFYEDPPQDSITLQEFEEYGVARLTFLRIIERHNMTSVIKYSQEWERAIKTDVKASKNVLVSTRFIELLDADREPNDNDDKRQASYEQQLEARRIDNISHFLLRLAFCRTEDLRKWMTNLEVDFFRYRFRKEVRSEIQKFLAHHDLNYNTIDITGNDKLRNNLLATYFSIDASTIDRVHFYEVPFTQVLDLVKSRRVYLRNGTAIIPHLELDTIVATRFRSKLSQFLAMTCKGMPNVEEDERLVRLLTDFDKRYTGTAYVVKGAQGSGVSAAMLDDLSKKSFPLCMKNLYDVVLQEHHLKHWGRLQLGLFFKAINLPMDEATKFWRQNFTKKAGMDGGRFDKQYLYNIRHMYGQEGKRTDYTPYSCMKIIMSSVGPGDHHGCPFRHSDATPLRAKLHDAMIPASGVKEILDLVEQKHYQIACQKYFEFTHGKTTIDGGVNHPNQYYDESQAVLSGSAKAASQSKKLHTTTVKQYPKPEIKKEPGSNEVVTDMDISNMLSDDDEELLSQMLEDPEAQTPAD